ncbi:MAG: hypothetical protein BGO98_25415 [Myxococcales bacterium 68-20]|nr:hypothetical protein [Myxococcales bacterium]OJY15990.1 MAG: hypothetical protein BGO98_25415 [Myxococcales bacterium 68-20]
MSSAYRSAYHHLVGVRLAEMKLARETVEPLLPRLRSIRAARIARALAGGVGIAGAIMTAVCACLDGYGVTYALLGSGAAALTTYVLARLLFAFGGAHEWTLPKLTGELDADLSRIESSNPFRPIARDLQALEVWSTTLPLAALSLLMPLTLHYGALALVAQTSPASFAGWIRISLVIVGHAHLALAGLAVAFGRKLTKLTGEGIASLPIHRAWARTWAITNAVSAVPGLLLLAVPPVLTAITGLAFIPFMFVFMRRRLMNERSAIELAEEATTARIAADAGAQLEALAEVDWAEVAAPEAPALRALRG